MHVYENVYDAVKREVLEETGLRVTSFYPDIRTKIYAPKDDDCFAFVPFCCQQQLNPTATLVEHGLLSQRITGV